MYIRKIYTIIISILTVNCKFVINVTGFFLILLTNMHESQVPYAARKAWGDDEKIASGKLVFDWTDFCNTIDWKELLRGYEHGGCPYTCSSHPDTANDAINDAVRDATSTIAESFAVHLRLQNCISLLSMRPDSVSIFCLTQTSRCILIL